MNILLLIYQRVYKDRIMRINLKTREDIDENFLQRIMYTDAYGYVSELINYL